MTDKLNTQDIIDALAEKHHISKKEAAGFVKELFLLIEDALEKDKIVKLKGFGTFKTIKVDTRESVNVNNGERFLIQGHNKIGFIPDADLRNSLNEPFAHFKTIMLPDDDNDIAPEDSQEQQGESEEEEKETHPEPKKTAPPQNIYEYIAAGVAAIVCGIILYIALSGDDKRTEITLPQVAAASEDIIEVLPVDTIAATITETKTQPENSEEEKTAKWTAEDLRILRDASPVKPDSVNYIIVGTKTTYSIRKGETLTRVSLRFYGTKDLWPYILKHNSKNIKNPAMIAEGTVLTIPELKEKNK
ncbi:DNA-binding protein HU [termite gut metagenome]|uniref:DNA-binding protein HU n=1 Tax=termite gut metagenome TaxID=433724 RepID=A0A5J4SAW5_9ZZZZ